MGVARVKSAALACALFAGSCTAFEDVEVRPGLPSTIGWATLIVEEADSRSVAALEPWPTGKFEADGRPEVERTLLGWTDADLRPLAEAGNLAGRSLMIAPECAPGLPAPSYCGTVAATGETLACDPDDAPNLAFVSFDAAPICDPTTIVVRTGCGGLEEACAPVLQARAPCVLGISGCTFLPDVEARIDGRGALCVDAPLSCRSESRPGTLGRYECRTDVDDCWLELERAPAIPMVEVVDRLRIVDAPLTFPDDYVGASFVGAGDLRRGYLRDLAIDGDRLFVAISGSGAAPEWKSICASGTDFSVRDASNGAELSRFTSPECTAVIVGDPQEPQGIVALMGAPGSQIVRRLDPSGAILAEARIGLDRISPGVLPYESADLVADPFRVVAMITTAGDDDRSFLIDLDPVTLAQRRVVAYPDMAQPHPSVAMSAIALSSAAGLFVAENVSQGLWIEASSYAIFGVAPFGGGAGNAAAAWTDGAIGAAALLGERPRVALVRRGANEARFTVAYERRGAPTAFGRWPGQASLLAVATLTDDGAFVGPLDLEAARHRTGGAIVGQGPVKRLLASDAGLWTIGTWSGELLRLSLR
jgi:hypothetical protein